MLLKERAQEATTCVALYLDDTLSEHGKHAEQAERFEQRIREIASRAVAHLRRGDLILLRTQSGRKLAASPSSGADPILTFLALLAPAEAERPRLRSFSDDPAEPYASAPLSNYPDSSKRHTQKVER
jgi:hypothetical protein